MKNIEIRKYECGTYQVVLVDQDTAKETDITNKKIIPNLEEALLIALRELGIKVALSWDGSNDKLDIGAIK